MQFNWPCHKLDGGSYAAQLESVFQPTKTPREAPGLWIEWIKNKKENQISHLQTGQCTSPLLLQVWQTVWPFWQTGTGRCRGSSRQTGQLSAPTTCSENCELYLARPWRGWVKIYNVKVISYHWSGSEGHKVQDRPGNWAHQPPIHHFVNCCQNRDWIVYALINTTIES